MINRKMKELIEAVGYLRLSREDGDAESSSITNQRSIIDDWAKNNGFIITDWYIDDGVSGYTMNRPDFNRLKSDLNNNKVNVIIVKNLSRIGRHNAKVNLFLEQIEEDGKRIVAIGDSYDTLDERSHDMVGIRTWMNEKYVRDTSKNIKDAIDRMQKEGRFICQVPYGYELDPFNKGVYYVDKTAAHYIREIFELYLNGYGASAIAKELKKRNVPTYWQLVQQRMERRGQQYKGNRANGNWSAATVIKMLKNDFYIGTLTLAKTKRRTINGKKVDQKEEDLIRFENAHEPLVDVKTFKLAQEILAERTMTNYRGSKKDEPCTFSGKLYCPDCGGRLTTASSAKTQRYVCRTYHLYGTDFCTSHTTNDRDLTAALIHFLAHCRENLSEAIADLKIISDKNKTQYQHDGIEILKKDKSRIEKEIEILIDQKMRETFDRPTMKERIDKTYASMLNSKYDELESISIRLEEMEETTSNEADMKKELESVLDIFDSIIHSKKLTRRQVETIVEKIIVHEDSGLDIFLKGDLHELCTNYIQFKHSNKEDIIKTIAKYAEIQNGHIMKRKCEQYTRAQGIRFDQAIFAKLYNNLIEYGYLIKISDRKGCSVPDVDKLKLAYKDDNVMAYSSRCIKLSVTMQLLNKIYNWYKDIKPRFKKF